MFWARPQPGMAWVPWSVFPGREDRFESFDNEANEVGLRAMPIRDQMDLQWKFIVAGIEQLRVDRERGGADK
jgi:hypothetical protein